MHFIVVLLLVRSHNGSARVWFQPGLFKSVFSKRAHSCLHHGGCILGLSARSSARVSSVARGVCIGRTAGRYRSTSAPGPTGESVREAKDFPRPCHVWTAPADQGFFCGVAFDRGCGHVFGLSMHEEGSDAPPRGGGGALGGFSQEMLQLGEHLLDRVEIGTVGRQEE